VLSSSNSGSLVNFSAGTKDVFVDYPASKAVYEDASGNIDSYPITGGAINGTTVGATTPAAGTFTTLTATGSGAFGTTVSGISRLVVKGGASAQCFRVEGVSGGFVNLDMVGNRTSGNLGGLRAFYETDSNEFFGIYPQATKVNTFFNLGNGSSAVTTQFALSHTASAVNYHQLTGSATGSGPIHSVAGSDTNIDLNLTTKGTGAVNLNTGNGTAFRVADLGGAVVAGLGVFAGSSSQNSVYLVPYGSVTNGNMIIAAKGSQFVGIGTNTNNNSNATEQMRVTHTASAVNYVQVTGAATGGVPTISAQGSDSNVSLFLNAKGTGNVFLQVGGANVFQAAGSSTSVNRVLTQASNTGVAPVVQSVGSDTNIPLVLQPKGTGALQAQQTDSTATGGNARGANAVDWQTIRSSASAVASAAQSVISGGSNNTASSQYGAIGGGVSNTVGSGGFVSTISGGFANSSNNSYTFVGGGTGNTASAIKSTVVGGANNSALGIFNFIGGGFTNSGTANAAVTSQSATMNGTTAVTLSGSNASIKVGQLILGTSISGDTYVAAISGTSLTLSQAASGSSTNSISFYTPHGVVVGGGNNTATGSYSFIGGGGDAGTAGNRNVASGDWSVVGGGRGNTASGVASFVGGGGFDGSTVYSNVASSVSTTVGGGLGNIASSAGATVVGGYFGTANGSMSTVVGGRNSTTRAISGNTVFSASSVPISGSANGFNQAALLILARQTTDATATVLCSDSGAASTTNQVILPNNSAYTFRGEIVSGVTGGGNSKSWTIEGLIKRGANAASTTLVGSTVTSMFADVGAATWTIALSADTTNGGLAITFTGQAATTIRTVCQIRTTEMTY
jgi:hypothetical protein